LPADRPGEKQDLPSIPFAHEREDQLHKTCIGDRPHVRGTRNYPTAPRNHENRWPEFHPFRKPGNGFGTVYKVEKLTAPWDNF
jgi:hypothetical protein